MVSELSRRGGQKVLPTRPRSGLRRSYASTSSTVEIRLLSGAALRSKAGGSPAPESSGGRAGAPASSPREGAAENGEPAALRMSSMGCTWKTSSASANATVRRSFRPAGAPSPQAGASAFVESARGPSDAHSEAGDDIRCAAAGRCSLRHPAIGAEHLGVYREPAACCARAFISLAVPANSSRQLQRRFNNTSTSRHRCDTSGNASANFGRESEGLPCTPRLSAARTGVESPISVAIGGMAHTEPEAPSLAVSRASACGRPADDCAPTSATTAPG
mmetsp:Transcript_113181/g.326992  ORF Transcript_113181/g.326992 Transcript_113181/m.326992 type:complete len:275 (+) Transcript_113181:2957-3781(+)